MLLFRTMEELTPCGMFTLGHLFLLLLTIYFIKFALNKTEHYSHDNVKKLIQKSTVLLWILEIIKIIYSINSFGLAEFNKYVPLYFCSLILYAGILSGFTKGKLKRVGDVFLATGSLVAGIIYLISPLTSLTTYPLYHFITFHSFFLHGLMVYLSLLIIKTKYITVELKDLKYFASLISIISIIALIFNRLTGSNLMFISQNYPKTFIEIIYNLTGPLFSLFMILVQATLPFLVVLAICKKVKTRKMLIFNIDDEENFDNLEISESVYNN